VYFVKAISFFYSMEKNELYVWEHIRPSQVSLLNLMTRSTKHKIPLNIYCSLPFKILKSKARYIIYYAEQVFKAAWNARALY